MSHEPRVKRRRGLQRLDDFLAAFSDEVCMNEAERSSERDSREARR